MNRRSQRRISHDNTGFAGQRGCPGAGLFLLHAGARRLSTETVYGLGADALNPEAVRSIFAAKGRPADNPLIVHIHDRAQLSPLCDVPDASLPLMDTFWPGPLTLLFPGSKPFRTW